MHTKTDSYYNETPQTCVSSSHSEGESVKTRKVIIEVLNGIASVAEAPGDVEVIIINYDEQQEDPPLDEQHELEDGDFEYNSEKYYPESENLD